jgi:nicotinamidase-related amidase
MRLSKADRPALLLVDIQKGFQAIGYWGAERNNPEAELRAAELLQLWRENQLPFFHIQHCSGNPASPLHETNAGNAFNDLVQPMEGEPVIKKNVNSAFIGTNLEETMHMREINTVVIVGLTTDHCISTTTRMAGNLGFNTFLVADATATFNKTGVDGKNYPAELIHETALASLHKEFATVVTTAFIQQHI